MVSKVSSFFRAALFFCAACISTPSLAETVVFKATDFAIRDTGGVPYYIDTAIGALAIDASIETNREEFAIAETAYTGEPGVFNISLMGLADIAGEAEYQLLRNDKFILQTQNPAVSVDNLPIAHKAFEISLLPGDVLSVRSKVNSNGLVSKDNEFAFSLGRWTELRLTTQGDTDFQADKVDLVTKLSTKESTIGVGDNATFEYTVVNSDETGAGAAATGVKVLLELPETFSPPPLGGSCATVNNPKGDQRLLSCSVAQIASGASVTGQISLQANEIKKESVLKATATANETDASGFNNLAQLSIVVEEKAPDEPDTDSTQDPITENDTQTQAGLLSVGSGLILFILLTARRRWNR